MLSYVEPDGLADEEESDSGPWLPRPLLCCLMIPAGALLLYGLFVAIHTISMLISPGPLGGTPIRQAIWYKLAESHQSGELIVMLPLAVGDSVLKTNSILIIEEDSVSRFKEFSAAECKISPDTQTIELDGIIYSALYWWTPADEVPSNSKSADNYAYIAKPENTEIRYRPVFSSSQIPDNAIDVIEDNRACVVVCHDEAVYILPIMVREH